MLSIDNNTKAFLELVRAGLWEKEARLLPFDKVDFEEVMRLAEEQSVVGLVTAGLEHVKDVKIPQEMLLQFVGQALQTEQQNTEMNKFIADLVEKMRRANIYTLLVKGQGIAQCYERPLWRSCGDVDLFLSEDNYNKAKKLLIPLSKHIEEEDITRLHFAMTIESWVVELHGSLRSHINKAIDLMLDEVQNDTFCHNRIRVWRNGETEVHLPEPNNDVLIVFTHILQHFFRGGIGLRQICDWCRLIWTYQSVIDSGLLEKRLSRMSILTKWKVFAALAVDWLGMPCEIVPLYSTNPVWHRKAKRLLAIVMDTGNFGHNREINYKQKTPVYLRPIVSLWWYSKMSVNKFRVFPIDAVKGWILAMNNGAVFTIKKLFAQKTKEK